MENRSYQTHGTLMVTNTKHMQIYVHHNETNNQFEHAPNKKRLQEKDKALKLWKDAKREREIIKLNSMNQLSL